MSAPVEHHADVVTIAGLHYPRCSACALPEADTGYAFRIGAEMVVSAHNDAHRTGRRFDPRGNRD